MSEKRQHYAPGRAADVVLRLAMCALPTLDGITNFRELGGLPTRDGRRVRARALFRSGHWGRSTEQDREELEQLGVGLVLDFRSDRDIEYEGADQLPAGTEHVALPIGDPAAGSDTRSLIMQGSIETLREHFGDGRAEQFMTHSAAAMVHQHSDNFARFLARLAQPHCPRALFHCSAGKDRAGWAASSLLLALGVDQTHVTEHYLLSNQTYDASKQHGALPQGDSEVVALVEPLTKVRAEYVQASIAAACERWGSLDGYFRDGLKLSDEQREQLRQNWLEDA